MQKLYLNYHSSCRLVRKGREKIIEEPKVSIIVPIYNSAKYLKQCVESILAQTYPNIEIILVNDGSKDNSLDIMRYYVAKDSRVKILSRENKGQFQTRKDGMKMATGKYITFVDSDDWIDTEMIENMLKIQNKYNTDIVRCNYVDEHVEENRRVPNPPIYPKTTYIRKNEFKEMVYPIFISTHQINSACGQIIRKSTIGEYESNPKIRIAEDLAFNLQLYQDIKNVVFIPENYYHYRANVEGITNIKEMNALKRKMKDIIYVYSQYYALIEKWGMNTELNQKLVTQRIFREIRRCIESTYTFKTSYCQKVEICQYARKLLENILLSTQRNISYLNIADKWLIEEKYKRLLIYKFFQYKLMYEVKKVIKKLLIILNRKKEKKKWKKI